LQKIEVAAAAGRQLDSIRERDLSGKECAALASEACGGPQDS